MSTFQHDFRCRQPVRSKRTRAAAWTGGSLYCPIHSDYGGLCPGRRQHYTFPGSAPRATLDHLYGSPRGGPGVGPDQTRPGPRSARTRGGTSSATELAFVVSRVTNVPRGSPRGTSTRSPRGKLTRAVVRLENDSWYATAITHGVPIRSRPFADCLGLFPTGARRRSGRARSGPSGSANPSRAADIHR